MKTFEKQIIVIVDLVFNIPTDMYALMNHKKMLNHYQKRKRNE